MACVPPVCAQYAMCSTRTWRALQNAFGSQLGRVMSCAPNGLHAPYTHRATQPKTMAVKRQGGIDSWEKGGFLQPPPSTEAAAAAGGGKQFKQQIKQQ
eukprot:1158728-Pelagomonas_calceolata.AAC.3